MKVLHINSFGDLSTGTIASEIIKLLYETGNEGILLFARGNNKLGVNGYKISNNVEIKIHAALSRITDKVGFYSVHSTRKTIEYIEKYKPDIIHLHNLHGYYINYPILFDYLSKKSIPIVWTLHDCWAYTGHCCYYSDVDCEKWKNKCNNCIAKHKYPKSILYDNSKNNFEAKKIAFTSIDDLTLVPVSQWLEKELRKSFFKEKNIIKIHNGINIEIFCPRTGFFKKKHSLENKKIILGVASDWDERKGLDDFYKLSMILPDEYKVVLVGLSQKQINQLPSNMLGLSRTSSAIELAEIYSDSDVYFNASTEETFGLTTVEALCCGTPCIVYDSTALPEAIINEECGKIVQKRNIDQVVSVILAGMNKLDEKTRSIVVEKFNKKKTLGKYIELYTCIIKKEEKGALNCEN